jgi:hypothetical protein
MVVRGWLDGQRITLSLRRGTLTVALDEETVLVLDQAGRLWSFYIQGHHFRRGLNGKILSKWIEKGARQRSNLWHSEADLVVQRACLTAQRLRERLEIETSRIATEVKTILTRASNYDIPTARADVDHYHQVYKTIGILPPDQYMALVLQVTEGCSFNTCTFCTFYKDRPFRIKSPHELRAHIKAVRTFLGDSLHLRRGIFLADANALVMPQSQMAALLEIVNEEIKETQGISGFLDGFSGQKKSPQDYAALAERGLRRIYVGLESGHDLLLTWARKPGNAADALAAVQQMKAGGISVGIIVLLGFGGERYNEGHVRDTIKVVNQMGLGRGDLLYFSEFIPYGTPFDANAPLGACQTQECEPDCWPLGRPEMRIQRDAIVAGLSFRDKRPKIATYHIREFVY